MVSLEAMFLSNAILVVPLAILAIIASRFVRQPAIRWSLWALVLVKFVTPSIAPLPLTSPLPMTNPDVKDTVVPWEVTVVPQELTVVPQEDTVDDAVPALGPLSSKLRSSPNKQTAGVIDAEPSPAESSPAERTGVNHIRSFSALGFVSASGTCLFLLLASIRIRQFRRLIRHAERADARTIETAACLAEKLGIKSPPDIRITSADISPILMGGITKTAILLPRGLIDSIDDDAKRTLLAHELSHVARRDHWVRWLEFGVRSLYWWHPIAWLAGSRLRDAEEQCCDASVVALLPELAVTYAQTIVATIDYFAEESRPVPLVATGFNPLGHSARSLHRRISMIRDKTTPRRPRSIQLIALSAVAACVLPLSLVAEDTTVADDSPTEWLADASAGAGAGTGAKDAPTNRQKMATPKVYDEIAVIGREYEMNAEVGGEYQHFLERAETTFPVLVTTIDYKYSSAPSDDPPSVLGLSLGERKAILRVTAPEEAQRVIGKFITAMNEGKLDAVKQDTAVLSRGDYEMTSECVDSFVQLLKRYQNEEVIKPLLVRQNGRQFSVTTYESIHEHIAEFIDAMSDMTRATPVSLVH